MPCPPAASRSRPGVARRKVHLVAGEACPSADAEHVHRTVQWRVLDRLDDGSAAPAADVGSARRSARHCRPSASPSVAVVAWRRFDGRRRCRRSLGRRHLRRRRLGGRLGRRRRRRLEHDVHRRRRRDRVVGLASRRSRPPAAARSRSRRAWQPRRQCPSRSAGRRTRGPAGRSGRPDAARRSRPSRSGSARRHTPAATPAARARARGRRSPARSQLTVPLTGDADLQLGLERERRLLRTEHRVAVRLGPLPGTWPGRSSRRVLRRDRPA